MSRRVIIFLCVATLWGHSARASGPNDGDQAATSTLWESVVTPGLPAFRRALTRGKELYSEANSRSALVKELRKRNKRRYTTSMLRELREAKLKAALSELSAATRALPGHSDGHLWYGRALYDLHRYEEAARELAEARKHPPRLDPRDAYQVAASLGIAYSKMEQLANAVEEYDRAVRLADEMKDTQGLLYSGRSTQLYNAAESLMALGRLDDAINRYKAALDSSRGSRDRRLVRWGLAVAYHRDNQLALARETALLAMGSDRSMRLLTSGEVFFVPDGEIHYYYAVGYWAQDRTGQARDQWKRFLDKLPNSPWAVRAAEQLTRLERANNAGDRPKKRLAPRPGQTKTDDEGRDRRQVSSRLYNYRHTLRRCYTDRLRKQPKLAGRVKLVLLVSPQGTLKRVKKVEDTVKSAALWQCVSKKLKKKYFGRLASKKPVDVEFTLEFKPGR